MTTPEPSGATARMPVLFVGHGSPMNALEDNPYSRAWRALGASIPEPSAILAVSAHWYVDGTYLTNNAAPETLHDFGGFPRALHEVQYPARGDEALAKRIADLLSRDGASTRGDWGLDHGTWSVLVHLRPKADVPVVQLSIDRRAKPETHLAIGRALAPLREQGVLILASGNVTHNLRHAMSMMASGGTSSPAWATNFDANIAKAVEQRDHDYLARAASTDEGRMAHPSPDHYFPLLYAAGATSEGDVSTFPVTGMDLGSLSMRSIRWG
jgi:4,5-DOPA dioxygenase extradiol